MIELTPAEIVTELEDCIVGQTDACRVLAQTLRTRWRHQHADRDYPGRLPPVPRMLLSGPPGSGKTHLMAATAKRFDLPFLRVESGLLRFRRSETSLDELILAELIESTASRHIDQSGHSACLDPQQIVNRAILLFDDIERLVASDSNDNSGEAIQYEILPLIAGSVVEVEGYGCICTQNLIVVCAGHLTEHLPADLMPELKSKLSFRVELKNLGESDLRTILRQSDGRFLRPWIGLLASEGIELSFTRDGIDALARAAAHINARRIDMGTHRLQFVINEVLDNVSFDAPSLTGKHISIDADYVQANLAPDSIDELSRFIL